MHNDKKTCGLYTSVARDGGDRCSVTFSLDKINAISEYEDGVSSRVIVDGDPSPLIIETSYEVLSESWRAHRLGSAEARDTKKWDVKTTISGVHGQTPEEALQALADSVEKNGWAITGKFRVELVREKP
jgi:hypothetical protein